MKLIKGLFLLLVNPRRFAREAADDAVAQELSRNPELIDKTTQNFPPEVRATFEASFLDRAEKFRCQILGGVGVTAATMLVGVAVGLTLRLAFEPVKAIVYGLQAVGAALILGATLAYAGREIETYKGMSLPERINAFAFRSLYVLGTFLFLASVAWDAK